MDYGLQQLSRSCAHTVRLALRLIAAMWSPQAAAAVSPFCPTKTLKSFFARCVFVWVAIATMVGLGLTFSTAVSATHIPVGHPSVTCTPRSATVANGGSVTIDLTTCDPYKGPPFNGLGFGTGLPSYSGLNRTVANEVRPAHAPSGTPLLAQTVVSSTTFSSITYTHNGDSATSDFFEIEDADNLYIRIIITITAPTSSIVVSPASISPTVGVAFSQTLSSTGGTGSYTYSLSSGTLPAGLTLTSGGSISGTPTQRTAFNFTIRSQDSLGAFVVKSYSGTVTAPTIALQTVAFTVAQNATPTAQLVGTGGIAPYTFSLNSGTLPTGTTMSPTGLLTGTPTTLGTFTPTILVDDSTTDPACPGCNFFVAPTVTYTVVAATVPGAPTIGAATPSSGAASIAFTAPGSNGGSVVIDYTVTCNVGGITATGTASPINVTSLTNGTSYTCSVKARNAVGLSAASGTVSVTPQGTQTITFAQPSAQSFGTTPTLAATSTSGLTPTFTSTTTGVCNISSGGALTFVSTGSCTISAAQVGNAAFLPAATLTQTFAVNPANQTVTFAPSTPVVFGVASSTLTATATSGLTAFTFATTSAPTICTVSGATLTITGGGSCALTATQAGNANFNSASASATVVVSAANQTVTFAAATPVVFGVASSTLTATATSGLTAFTFASTTPLE